MAVQRHSQSPPLSQAQESLTHESKYGPGSTLKIIVFCLAAEVSEVGLMTGTMLDRLSCVRVSRQLPLSDSSGRWRWWWYYTVSGTRLPGSGWRNRDYQLVLRWGSRTKPSSCHRILERLSLSHWNVWWNRFCCCRHCFHTDRTLYPEKQ